MSQTKLCPSGHIMDASWDRCPYCPVAGPKAAVPPTRVLSALPAAPPAAPPVSSPRPPSPQPPAGALRTRLLASQREEEKRQPVVGWLVVLDGSRKGEDFRIREGRNSVGSDPSSDIVLPDPHVSGKHANINSALKDGERTYVLADLDSRNGTFLNDSPEPVHREELVDNDTITFGTTTCKFKCL